MAGLKKHSSGDQAGNYYTDTPDDLYSVSVPAGIGGEYMSPALRQRAAGSQGG